VEFILSNESKEERAILYTTANAPPIPKELLEGFHIENTCEKSSKARNGKTRTLR